MSGFEGVFESTLRGCITAHGPGFVLRGLMDRSGWSFDDGVWITRPESEGTFSFWEVERTFLERMLKDDLWSVMCRDVRHRRK